MIKKKKKREKRDDDVDLKRLHVWCISIYSVASLAKFLCITASIGWQVNTGPSLIFAGVLNCSNFIFALSGMIWLDFFLLHIVMSGIIWGIQCNFPPMKFFVKFMLIIVDDHFQNSILVCCSIWPYVAIFVSCSIHSFRTVFAFYNKFDRGFLFSFIRLNMLRAIALTWVFEYKTL